LLLVTTAQADADEKRAYTEGTETKRRSDINRWKLFLSQAGKEGDTFLESIKAEDRFQQGDYFRGFLAYYRRDGFSTKGFGTIGAGRLGTALGNIASHFEDEGLKNPIRSASGKLNPALDRQFKAYKNEDPAVKRQPALPLRFFKKFIQMEATETSEAIAQLFCGGLHFGMRSCEYSRTNEKKPRTKILRVGNIKFYDKHGREMKSNRKNAEFVKITFVNQKNGQKMETQTRRRKNSILCAVRQWAAVIDRILGYGNTNESTTINTVRVKGRLMQLTSDQVRLHVKAAVTLIGEDYLQVKASEIGTHTLRVSFATMCDLEGVAPKKIMMAGRWLSTAFMKYVRDDSVLADEIADAITNGNNNNIIRLR